MDALRLGVVLHEAEQGWWVLVPDHAAAESPGIALSVVLPYIWERTGGERAAQWDHWPAEKITVFYVPKAGEAFSANLPERLP